MPTARAPLPAPANTQKSGDGNRDAGQKDATFHHGRNRQLTVRDQTNAAGADVLHPAVDKKGRGTRRTVHAESSCAGVQRDGDPGMLSPVLAGLDFLTVGPHALQPHMMESSRSLMMATSKTDKRPPLPTGLTSSYGQLVWFLPHSRAIRSSTRFAQNCGTPQRGVVRHRCGPKA